MITAITIAKMRFFMFSPSNSVKYLMDILKKRAISRKNNPVHAAVGLKSAAPWAKKFSQNSKKIEKCLVHAHRCWSNYTISNILCKALLLMYTSFLRA
jgi:hypothetical protein